ncbi:MAG: hypothetical protein HS116_18290 [Planctomycetes bacterium]|nr:hypothetical protein [Planctomycetota bacterium]
MRYQKGLEPITAFIRRPPRTALSLGKIARPHGRSSEVIRCVCGAESEILVATWARHGKARCTACRRWIYRSDLKASKKRLARKETA